MLRSRSILQHVFGLGKEYLAPPERHEGEEEEDGPGDADEDDHDAVPHDEPGQIKDIRQDPNDGDETNIRKPAIQIQITSTLATRRMEGREKTRSKSEKGRWIRKRNARERPATKNLAQMFVELEPVRENSEREQEDGETEQHHSGHDAGGIPNLSCGRCHEVVKWQAKEEKDSLSERGVAGQP